MDNNAPVDKDSKEATFAALAAKFGFDDKVRELFIDGPMENLEDFRYYFANEKEIDAFVSADDSLRRGAEPDLKIQIARVRRAWAVVRQNGLRKENRNTASSGAELDDLLEEGTLREVKVQFWKRYKMKYPAEVSPSDQLLSRCYRELDKRLLTVCDIWKVKTLRHQVMTTKKRKQVGTDLYTFEDEAEETPETRDVEKYLAMLYTYLLALSITGSNKVHGAPVEEAFGSDSTKLVGVPWDVLQSYHFRASRAAMSVPEASRLAWLEGKDIAERAAWVSQFREGDEPLGQVVQSVMEKRGAHWDTPIQNLIMNPRPAFPPQPRATSPHPAPPPQPPRAVHDPKKQRQGQQDPPPPPRSPEKMKPSTALGTPQEGKTLCSDFNKGKCNTKGASCDKGLHRCSKVVRGGKTCEMSNHGAHNCRIP
jgi:hypothetical protein